MKICMFTNTYLPHVGGVARSVDSFSRCLRRLNHDVLIVAPTFPGSSDDETDVVRVPALQNFNGSDFSVRLAIPGYLHDEMESFGPQVIHSHHPFLMGDSALRVARRRQLPLVFTHHTMYERYTHYVPFESDAMKRLAVELSKSYANLCSHVIAPSESVARIIRERGVYTPVDVVPTGVDVERFKKGDRERGRESLGLGDKTFVIGYVGRLAYEKNLEYVAEAAALLLKRHVDTTFVAVGEGDARTRMAATFEAHGVAGRALFAGKKTGDELCDVYAALDLFTFASKTETQGMVLTEAMAAGVPVLALDAAGVREVVRDGENGRLLDGGVTSDRFAEVLTEMYEARTGDLPAMRKAAYETAASFSEEACTDKLVEIYRDVIGGGAVVGGHSELAEMWDQVRRSLSAEWELLSEKMSALSASVFQEKRGTEG